MPAPEPAPDAAAVVTAAEVRRCRGVTAKGFPCAGEAVVGRYCETCVARQSPARKHAMARVSPLGAVLMAAFVYTIYKLATTGVYLRLLDF